MIENNSLYFIQPIIKPKMEKENIGLNNFSSFPVSFSMVNIPKIPK